MKTPSLTKKLMIAMGLLSLSATMPGSAAFAQAQGPDAGPEKIKQVIVYGNDPCPTSTGDEIAVCARLPDKDRYRIPKELRTDPNDPKVQSWMNRAESIEYVGRSGTDSCSPVGAGGATGCFQKLARNARAERKALLGDSSWSDLVAAEREKRLSTIDADSESIERQAKAEEAADRAQARISSPVEGNAGAGTTPYP
ncbi:MAG TPA: hypothetical protein VF503_09690 [Sphingobium sp.]|uniref:hypothetical protein n=1 Tax=Sphingobium sp. TaxID=1912891 RepID=UPI002ED3E7D1